MDRESTAQIVVVGAHAKEVESVSWLLGDSSPCISLKPTAEERCKLVIPVFGTGHRMMVDVIADSASSVATGYPYRPAAWPPSCGWLK